MNLQEKEGLTDAPQPVLQYNYNEVAEHITNYKNKSMTVIPVSYQDKITRVPKWTKRSVEDCDIEKEFSTAQNIGIVLGTNSNGLIDIDLDCLEAVKLAPYFLPETDCIFGHENKPNSHWIYNVGDGYSTTKYNDQNETLLEIRSNGSYTVFPPSKHYTGATIKFYKNGDPAMIDYADLQTASNKLAAASLVLKHWSEGNRNSLTMALAGLLRKEPQWTEIEVSNYIIAIAENAGDEELRGLMD